MNPQGDNMSMQQPRIRPVNLVTLRDILPAAERERMGVGAFSPRYLQMIRPVLRACQAAGRPAIVQISQKELIRGGIAPAQFADVLYRELPVWAPDIPVVLHLDHTKDLSIIVAAIRAGFTSVMIDASEHDLEENIRRTVEVVALAAPCDVSVEAELGRIGTTDFVETDTDEQMYTRPDEAGVFASRTGVDALAVSVGTAHGHYLVREPKIEYNRLADIRRHTGVPLVLHGGSGVPADMIRRAIGLSGGGISKVNIATDLEAAMLHAMGLSQGLPDEALSRMPAEQITRGEEAVQKVVAEKLDVYLSESGHPVPLFEP